MPLYQDGELRLPAHNTHASSAKTPMTRPTLSPTAASTLQPDKIVREDLQDLDDNDDAVSQSTSIAYSQATVEGSSHLRVVRLQDLSHSHEPFECPYCYSIVQARRERSWRKHVLSDLRAYVCMFKDCDAGLFEDKAAWARHDTEEHRRQWDCQHCRDTDRPFSSSQGLHEHLRALHAGDGLPAEVLAQVVEASSRPLVETAPDCPLCDFDVDVHREAGRLGQAIPSCSQAVIPLAELQKHLALHQEQLALFAIPPAVERGVESESRHGRSQVGPDEQIKVSQHSHKANFDLPEPLSLTRNQMMADWQDDMSELDAVEEARQFQDSELDISLAGGSTEESPTPLVQPHSSTKSPVELPGIDTALYKPQEGDSSSISPGDIVYISRLNGEQLIYDRAVYLGKIGDGQHVARDWNTKNDLKVSLSELVRKEHVTEDETIEAESIVSYVVPPNSEMLSKSRFYLKHATVPHEIKFSFMAEVDALAAGGRRLVGYGTDRAVVRRTCSVFLAYKSPLMDRNVRVEELLHMFYASAVFVVPEAGVESHAALLTDVLIRVIDETSEQIFPERNIVSAQLCEEQAGMLSRANRAVQDAKGLSSATSDELAASTLEDRLKEATLSPDFLSVATQNKETPSTSLDHLRNTTLPLGIMSTLIMKASKLGSGDEMLVGCDEATVRTTFSSFMRQYGTKVLDRSVCVKDIVHMFYASAESDLAKDTTLSAIVRTELVERHAALLTEVLIGIIDQVTERYFPDRDIVSSQLREEQADMMSRANQASRDAKSDVTSGEHDGSTREERLKEAELSSQSIEALKSRLNLVIDSEETGLGLSKFGAHLMRQTCSSFLAWLQYLYIHGRRRMQLVAVLEAFYECARTEIRQDRATSNKESRSVAAERLVVSLLDLLITIDAGSERESFNTTPTDIPGRITAVLMEERSRYLTQASEIEKRLFRVPERSKPEFDIHFFTKESRRAHDERYGEMMAGGGDEPNGPDDPSEPKYCYCLRGSHGVMVACDGPNCRRKWFHLSCTDLKKPLSDYKTWFCIFCQPPVSKAAEDTPEATAAAIFDEDNTEPEPIETQDADETAQERPPRGMVCNDCKFVWRSVSASELRDCPNCGSYSVFAGSPPRATLPEGMDIALRPDATGEEALGQYFSERTDKFMSLYRRETLAGSKPELPREDFPDPSGFLHTSSSANSTRLEESPPALFDGPLPDVGTFDNTSEDVSALEVNPDLCRVRRTIMYLKYTIEVFHLTQSQNSYPRSITGNIREVYDQICNIARTLGNLLQDNDPQGAGLHPEWELKLQGFGSSLSTLCLSMNITLEDLNNALGSSEADKWEEVVRKMEDDEKVGCLKRFEWYRILIAILLTLAEGSTNEHLLSDKLRFEGNISSLLRLQNPDGLQAGHKGEAVTTTAEEPAVGPPDSGASGNTTEDRSTLVTDSDLFAVLQLRQALGQIGHANRILNQAYSESNGDFSGDEDINYLKRRLRSVGDSLRKLLGDRSDDAEYMIELRSLHDISSAFCSSIEITLEDLLIAVKSGDARQWSHTLRMMEEVESVGLLERFRYYEELVVDFNIVWMDAGFRTDLWSDPHERVRELLTSQESNSLQVAVRNSHHQAIWPVEMKPQPALQGPQLEDEQIGGGSDEPLKLEDPPALQEDLLPDNGASSSTTGDASTPVFDYQSITVYQLGQALGIIKYAARRLIKLHSRSSRSITSTSESEAAEGQLRMARDLLNRLLRRQCNDIDDAERTGNTFYTLCSRIENALQAALTAIDSPEDAEDRRPQEWIVALRDLEIALARSREEFKALAPEANVSEMLRSHELDSSQVAGGEFYRQDNPDWPIEENPLSDSHEPQVEDVEIERGLDGSPKLFRHEEEETAVPENPASSSHGRDQDIQEDHEVTSAGPADRMLEFRVIAPSPPSSVVGENEEATTLSGGPAARRGPHAAGPPEDEGEEGIITSEDHASAYRDDRGRESQEKPADMPPGSADQRPAHPGQPEPYPRPAPREPDWTPKKLADLMLQRSDQEPALAPTPPAVNTLSEDPPSDPSYRGRARRARRPEPAISTPSGSERYSDPVAEIPHRARSESHAPQNYQSSLDVWRSRREAAIDGQKADADAVADAMNEAALIGLKAQEVARAQQLQVLESINEARQKKNRAALIGLKAQEVARAQQLQVLESINVARQKKSRAPSPEAEEAALRRQKEVEY
jgi:hypothetical protein